MGSAASPVAADATLSYKCVCRLCGGVSLPLFCSKRPRRPPRRHDQDRVAVRLPGCRRRPVHYPVLRQLVHQPAVPLRPVLWLLPALRLQLQLRIRPGWPGLRLQLQLPLPLTFAPYSEPTEYLQVHHHTAISLDRRSPLVLIYKRIH